MMGAILGTLLSGAIGTAPIPAQATDPSKQLPLVTQIDRPDPPTKIRLDSLGVKTSARSVFVADVASGEVLYAKNPHEVLPIASITKLVTAMTFLDMKPDLSRKIVMAETDYDNEGKMAAPPGETLSLHDALESMVVGSVNAHANAIARVTVGMGPFVVKMNEKIKSLGLKTPTFVEPSGVDAENRASAADVAAIVTAASGYPEIREFARERAATIHGATKTYIVKSTNLLLDTYVNKSPYSIVVAKTGSLPEAGYCMAQLTTQGEGKTIVTVELGSENHFSRYEDIKALTTWAFDTYRWE